MRIIIYICEIYIYTDIQAKHCYIDFVDSFGAQLTEVLCGWCMYGHLGNRRYPLPACAYEKIRREFMPAIDNDFVGFVEEDSS